MTRAATIDPTMTNNQPHTAWERDAALTALAAVPAIIEQLDDDGREMFGKVLQQAVNAGYREGFADGQASTRLPEAEG